MRLKHQICFYEQFKINNFLREKMEDLSVPFRRASAKVVDKIAEVAKTAKIVHVGKKGLSSWTIIGIVLTAIAIYYFYSKSKSTEDEERKRILKEEQVRQKATKPKAPPRVDPLISAEKSISLMEKCSTQQDKIKYHNAAIQNFTEALASGEYDEDALKSGTICLKLAKLYHQGVSETFDSESKIPGVIPDAQQGILYYREAIKLGLYEGLIPLANIYHWGLAGFEGNREVAMHLYGVVLKVGNDYEKGIAKDRLRQMREEEGKSLGTGMLDDDSPLATSFGPSSMGSNPYQEHFMDIGKSPYDIGRDETTRGIDEKYVDDLIHNKLGLNGKRLKTPKDKKIKVISDPQNARDHVVVNSAKQSMERLRASTNIQYDVPTTFKMLHEYITNQCDLSEAKRESAADVLKEMAKGIANLGYEQSKEIEALHLVWNRIQSQTYAQDKEKRTLLIDNLVCELAECIEYGEFVCPTGRLNRIIDSLNFLDPIVKIQPQWAVRQTMVAKAGAIEKTMLNKCRGEIRDAVKNPKPNARERQLANEFSQKLKSAIDRDLTRSYVDTGLMTKELLKTELDSWML